jgi:hypothetical protein
MASPAMSKALRLALDVEKQRPISLASRVCIARLTALLADRRKDSISKVTSIVISEHDAESFLRGKLGPGTWDALHELTRDDLVEAEQRLSQAYAELGAGHRDWGSLSN